VAGNGHNNSTGDGHAAILAGLYYPVGVALDAQGNFYVADKNNNRIRMVNTNGIISTVAGNGSPAYAGDGGAATNASINAPSGVTFDAAGNLVIDDDANNCIREVHLAGYPVLTLTNLSTASAGNYTVVITSPSGSVTSRVATLTMVLPPIVAGAPINQTNVLGTTAVFNVTATGTGPFSYQWQWNGTNLPNNLITTITGKTTHGFSGDNGPATNGTLYDPHGVGFDTAGNLYIADQFNHRIRKIDTNGIISTVAGNGAATYAGDGGTAITASLYNPQATTFDATGNLYIADGGNNRIRLVNTNGFISTVAGNGTPAYTGDGGPATNASLDDPTGVTIDAAGNLFIADSINNVVRRVDTNGTITTVAGNGSPTFAGDFGPATSASLYRPSGVVFDTFGNLYIADADNERIRMVNTNGIISTIAGTGTGGYIGDGGAATNAKISLPSCVAFDSSGNLCIADYINNRVREVDTNGYITTVAGNGTGTYTGDGGVATNASLYRPSGVAFDAAGNLFIADYSNNRIRKVHLAGDPALVITNVSQANAGNYSVVITSPYGSITSAIATLTATLGPIINVEPVNQTNLAGGMVTFNITAGGIGALTYQWQLNGTNLPSNVITTIAGNGTGSMGGDGGKATSALLYNPSGVTFDAAGDLLIADSANNRVRMVNTRGIISTVVGNGTPAFAGDSGPATNASINNPARVAFDALGNLYITDTQNQRVRKVNTNGTITTVAGNGTGTYAGDNGTATSASLHNPIGVAFDVTNNVYIADDANNRIRRVKTNGVINTIAGNGTGTYAGDNGIATSASLYNPNGIAFDAAGNLYIADAQNFRVRMVATNGNITTVAGNGTGGYSGDGGLATAATFGSPRDVAFDSLGNLYIADYYYGRVRKVGTNGIISIVAGKGTTGTGAYSGDGGPATNAALYGPSGLAFDVSGNLYIADQENNRIRKVFLYAEYPSLTLQNLNVTNAGNYSVVITSPYGSVTSSPVTLAVTIPSTPPQITTSATGSGATSSQSGFGFNLGGAIGQTIVVDGSTNMIDWMPLYTNISDGTTINFNDPTATNYPGRFYRARLSQ